MKTEAAVASGWDDLIFENRNKEYGAYDIRRSYSGNATTAMMICMLAAAGVLLLSGFAFSSEDKIEEPVDGKGELIIIDMPPIEPLHPKEQKRVIPPPSKAVRNVPPLVTIREVPDQPELTDEPVFNAADGAGDPDAGVEVFTGGSDEGVAEPAVVVPPPPVDFAEVMPSYAGGLKEMVKDLGEELRYPVRAKRQTIEGTVFVGFVVNSRGQVVDVKVIRGINDECDKEAMRVVSGMTKWKAGTQNGKPVSVKMVLPVKFKINSI